MAQGVIIFNTYVRDIVPIIFVIIDVSGVAQTGLHHV